MGMGTRMGIEWGSGKDEMGNNNGDGHKESGRTVNVERAKDGHRSRDEDRAGSARCLLLGLAGRSAADPEGAFMTAWQCGWR